MHAAITLTREGVPTYHCELIRVHFLLRSSKRLCPPRGRAWIRYNLIPRLVRGRAAERRSPSLVHNPLLPTLTADIPLAFIPTLSQPQSHDSHLCPQSAPCSIRVCYSI